MGPFFCTKNEIDFVDNNFNERFAECSVFLHQKTFILIYIYIYIYIFWSLIDNDNATQNSSDNYMHFVIHTK